MYLADGMPLNAVEAPRLEPAGALRGRRPLPAHDHLPRRGPRHPAPPVHHDQLERATASSTPSGWAEPACASPTTVRAPGSAARRSTCRRIAPTPSTSWWIPSIDFVQVWLDDELAFQDIYKAPEDAVVTIGADALGDPKLEDTYAGRLDPLPERNRALCEELRREAGRLNPLRRWAPARRGTGRRRAVGAGPPAAAIGAAHDGAEAAAAGGRRPAVDHLERQPDRLLAPDGPPGGLRPGGRSSAG